MFQYFFWSNNFTLMSLGNHIMKIQINYVFFIYLMNMNRGSNFDIEGFQVIKPV
jgi:hypothetical protein